jgi:hypothetical protein
MKKQKIKHGGYCWGGHCKDYDKCAGVTPKSDFCKKTARQVDKEQADES